MVSCCSGVGNRFQLTLASELCHSSTFFALLHDFPSTEDIGLIFQVLIDHQYDEKATNVLSFKPVCRCSDYNLAAKTVNRLHKPN